MKMTDEEALEVAEEFLDFITDKNGNIREDKIDFAWETLPDVNGYYIRLYVDWEYEDPTPELERRLDTFVEVHKKEDLIEQSSCYGWYKEDIASEILTVYGWIG